MMLAHGVGVEITTLRRIGSIYNYCQVMNRSCHGRQVALSGWYRLVMLVMDNDLVA